MTVLRPTSLSSIFKWPTSTPRPHHEYIVLSACGWLSLSLVVFGRRSPFFLRGLADHFRLLVFPLTLFLGKFAKEHVAFLIRVDARFCTELFLL